MARLIYSALASVAAAAVVVASLASAVSADSRPRGVVEDCSRISGIGTSKDFTRRQNLVVGPLVIWRAARPWSYRAEGEKLFVVVRGGHRVTLELSPATRRDAGLVFGWFRNPNVELRDARRVVTFVACNRGEWPPGTVPDGWPVSGWVGGLVASEPRCIPLRIWIDDEQQPRRAVIKFGLRSCD